MRSKLLELITAIWAFALLTPVSAQQHIYQDPTYAQVDALIAAAAGKTPPTPTGQQLYMHPTYEQVDRLITTVKAGRSMISATNPTFSNAVLTVNVDFVTNTTGVAYVAVTNALAGFGFDAEALAELSGGKVYGSIGTLLAALAAAVVWLKKNKVQTLKLDDGSIETSADGGVAKLDDFFTESTGYTGGLPTPTGKLKNAKLDQAVQIILGETGGEDEKAQTVFREFAKMDGFTKKSVESDSFDIAITKLSQLLGKDITA